MTVDADEIRRLASELRAAPHLMLRIDLDLAADLLDLLAEVTPALIEGRRS